MDAEIIPFKDKDVEYKCSYCKRACKPVIKAEDDNGLFLGQYICKECIKKMTRMLNENKGIV